MAILCSTLLLTGCGPETKEVDRVQEVIGSMSDTLPKIALPEGVDPESGDWKDADLKSKEPVLPKYPEEQEKHFLLYPGYKMTPILTEPEIEQPGAIAFDGNGRMYVLELRTYMQNIDSEGTLEPVSRISRWEDKDDDGIYETGTIFVDGLIFPRFVLPYGKDCILSMNSNADEVYKYTDTDGDGKSDKKELFTKKYGRSGNVETQPSFMYWGMDNWLYSTINAFRIRETSAAMLREPTGYNHSQWGITHDDDGKLWFQSGSRGLPSIFQIPVHYGNFQFDNEFAEGFDIPWGAPVKVADMQGGMDEVRQPDGSSKKVTGAAGNDIYRGDRLPKDLYGQYFYGEVVARIVRQINPVVKEGLTTLHNVYQDEKSEFIRSTDPLFRPVDMVTAPDGTMYIADMYQGVIQEGQYMGKGGYLRAKVQQYQLDKIHSLGRIWRLTHESKQRDQTRPNMLNETPAELVEHLNHPNGWWRDKAQQLIVLIKDKSVSPKLEKIVRTDKNLLSRFHALWSLEGLGTLSPELLMALFDDPNPRMRIQAIRASETLYKAGHKSFSTVYLKMMKDADTNVAIQAMLTANILQVADLEPDIKSTMERNKDKGIQVIGQQILDAPKGALPQMDRKFNTTEQQSLERGVVIFNELCAQCHGVNGTGTPFGEGQTMAPSLVGSDRVQSHPEYVVRTLLNGLQGPLEGKTYPGGLMVGMADQSDQWIADILSYIRVHLSNDASMVTEEEVKELRQKTADQYRAYKYEELISVVPKELIQSDDWKITASHAFRMRQGFEASAKDAFSIEGWSTGERQVNGMWFQIEFPKPTEVTEIWFSSYLKRRAKGKAIRTYPRAYEIQVSKDGKDWKVIKEGTCESDHNVIAFNPIKTKFIRMVQTGDPEEEGRVPWSMQNMKLYGH